MDKNRLNVLFAVWELEPFLKVGGLGEVARSLPIALKSLGVDIRLIIPDYRALKTYGQRKTDVAILHVPYGKQRLRVTIHKINSLDIDIPVYLVGNHHYLDTPIPETFPVFNAAIIEALSKQIFHDWKPHILHCNDNHCGFLPLLCKIRKIPVKTLLTIHCISHQRKFSQKEAQKLHIPYKDLSLVRWETKNRQFNMLYEGIIHADWINTVSPTYLKEIQTEEGVAGLDEVIRKYSNKISAILNGIDYTLKNPETNMELAARYSVKQELVVKDTSVIDPVIGKRKNKIILQKRLGLPLSEGIPVIGFIGRMDPRQKGIELIHRMIVRQKEKHCQYVIMGQGDELWEERFQKLHAFYPNRVAVVTAYNDALAPFIYAGSDFMMIPSHFEPCCLIQMHAMRYGAIPIVRETGGLTDTVIDGKNGFVFTSPTSFELERTILKAIRIKRAHPKRFAQMVKAAMNRDFSWNESAKQYLDVYKRITS